MTWHSSGYPDTLRYGVPLGLVGRMSVKGDRVIANLIRNFLSVAARKPTQANPFLEKASPVANTFSNQVNNNRPDSRSKVPGQL